MSATLLGWGAGVLVGAETGSRSTIRCFKCKEVGHLLIKCPQHEMTRAEMLKKILELIELIIQQRRATEEASKKPKPKAPRFECDITHICSTSGDDQLHVDVTLQGERRTITIPALVDSGASHVFMSKQFVEQMNMRLLPFPEPIPLYNVDGTLNKEGSVTHYTVL